MVLSTAGPLEEHGGQRTKLWSLFRSESLALHLTKAPPLSRCHGYRMNRSFGYLSRRMDSVFLSLSSHVSFSSAMIFSVSCDTRARVSARSDQLTMPSGAEHAVRSYHQPLCGLFFADGLRGNRLLSVLHQLVGGRVLSRHLIIWKKIPDC